MLKKDSQGHTIWNFGMEIMQFISYFREKYNYGYI